jgi:phenylalanyl-tRNA synthetase beta chain
MKLPISWLNEFVKVDDIPAEELAEKLTRAGLQVEGIEVVGKPLLSDHFVVVEVLECENHPDSDHLHVCKVSDGTEVYQVVCGAPNMRKGIKTAFAKIGAVIPDGEFKIKKGKLRGVESFGMCCSSRELKLGIDHDGIMEFDLSTPVGTFVRDAVPGEKPETVLDVDVTWNRPDALSIVGLAREFAAILNRELKLPDVDFVESDRDVNDEVKVIVEDTVKCPRYTARVITSVEDGQSPDFIRKRLEYCGMRSLGLVVDVTNYVMLELGAPLHAFDHTTLDSRTIVVRTACAGEKMTTLDGVERTLDESMLMICDAVRPNAVAGIMGGEESEIASGTRTVMLESALFEPTSTKFTATKLSLSSEAAYRYIRGVDKDVADFASRRAAHLLQKYGSAVIAKGVVDVDNRKKPLNENVTLDFNRARRLIGISIDNDAMVLILKLLGLKEISGAEDFSAAKTATFRVPSWRWDIENEADLVEEIARIHGLDNIPDTMPSAPSVSNLSNRPFRARSKVREIANALGFSEAMHYSFLSEKELDNFDDCEATRSTRLLIPDPVSADYGAMRSSLMPQLYATLGKNASHETEGAMLFEIGKVFSNVGGRPGECEKIALGFVGPVGRDYLRSRLPLGEEEALLWMKGAVTELLKRLHAGKLEFIVPSSGNCHKAFALGAQLNIKLNGREIGVLGALSQKMRHPYRLTTAMVICEMDLESIIKNFDRVGKVSSVAQYPAVRRDIALVAESSVTNMAIESVIRKNGGKDLVKVAIFDIFKSKDLKCNARSMAYALEFRSSEKTLTDDEVGRAFQRIVDALKATAGVEVREN